MQEIGKYRKSEESRKSENIGNQKKQEIRKCMKWKKNRK